MVADMLFGRYAYIISGYCRRVKAQEDGAIRSLTDKGSARGSAPQDRQKTRPGFADTIWQEERRCATKRDENGRKGTKRDSRGEGRDASRACARA